MLCNIHSHGVRHCPWCTIGAGRRLSLIWASIVGVTDLHRASIQVSALVLDGRGCRLRDVSVVGGVLALAIGPVVWILELVQKRLAVAA